MSKLSSVSLGSKIKFQNNYQGTLVGIWNASDGIHYLIGFNGQDNVPLLAWHNTPHNWFESLTKSDCIDNFERYLFICDLEVEVEV